MQICGVPNSLINILLKILVILISSKYARLTTSVHILRYLDPNRKEKNMYSESSKNSTLKYSQSGK